MHDSEVHPIPIGPRVDPGGLADMLEGKVIAAPAERDLTHQIMGFGVPWRIAKDRGNACFRFGELAPLKVGSGKKKELVRRRA
jgi:hypothetical protein